MAISMSVVEVQCISWSLQLSMLKQLRQPASEKSDRNTWSLLPSDTVNTTASHTDWCSDSCTCPTVSGLWPGNKHKLEWEETTEGVGCQGWWTPRTLRKVIWKGVWGKVNSPEENHEHVNHLVEVIHYRAEWMVFMALLDNYHIPSTSFWLAASTYHDWPCNPYSYSWRDQIIPVQILIWFCTGSSLWPLRPLNMEAHCSWSQCLHLQGEAVFFWTSFKMCWSSHLMTVSHHRRRQKSRKQQWKPTILTWLPITTVVRTLTVLLVLLEVCGLPVTCYQIATATPTERCIKNNVM
jgi:hypothetical protein